MSGSDPKVLKREPLNPRDAKWTALELVTYNDPNSQTRQWESAYRPTRPKTTEIDCVGITPILQPAPNDSFDPATASPLAKQVQVQGPSLLLQKQFRAPADKVCIEIPAGLMDERETAEECAIRELKEETGFVGQVIKDDFGVSGIMWNDPGFCNTNLRMIQVTVDLSAPANQNPQPELEESEFIECFALPIRDLWPECQKLEQQGFGIDARVGTLAQGVELAKRFGAFR